MEGELISVGEAARRLGVCAATVRRMSAEGVLESVRTAGGHRRFRVSQVELLTQSPAAQRPEATPAHARLADVPVLPAPRRETPRASGAQLVIRSPAPEPRLRLLKLQGQLFIPPGTPDRWRARVLRRLEGAVTAENFPSSLSLLDTRTLLAGEVEDELAGYRDELAGEAARERERELAVLVSHGQRYVRRAAGHLPSLERRNLTEELASVLEGHVESDWTQAEVEDLVDEVLEEWAEDQDAW